MEPRIEQLIRQLPNSSYQDIATAQQIRAIFNKNHIHPTQVFLEITWLDYLIVDTNNIRHTIQLIFFGPGSQRNSLFCLDCKEVCKCAIVAMIHFISTQDPLRDRLACPGCGEILH